MKLTVQKQTDSAITVSWAPVPGAVGFAFFRDGERVSHTMDATRSSVSFRIPDKNPHTFGVQALALGDSASVGVNQPTPQPPTPGDFSGNGSACFLWGSWYQKSLESSYAKFDAIATDIGGEGITAPKDLPGVLVLLYRSALSVAQNWDTSLDWNQANQIGLLKDSGGNLIYNNGNSSENIIDFSKPVASQAIGNHAVQMAQQYGFKGIDLDDVVYGWGPMLVNAMPSGWTQDQWSKAIVSHVRRIFKIVRDAGLYIAVNCSGYVPAPHPGSDNSDNGINQQNLFKLLGAPASGDEAPPSGLSVEYWLQFTWQGGVIKSENAWDNWRGLHGICNSLGVDFVPGFHSPSAGDNANLSYAKATFLLDWAGGTSALWATTDNSNDPFGMNWCKKMGKALGPATQSGNSWTRKFQNGLVVVDPVAGTATIS